MRRQPHTLGPVPSVMARAVRVKAPGSVTPGSKFGLTAQIGRAMGGGGAKPIARGDKERTKR
jgi:hypothetical protein